jgi:hypothetical protein
MDTEREMTLVEWCGKLPNIHLANRQLNRLEDAFFELLDLLEHSDETMDTNEYWELAKEIWPNKCST